MGVNKHILKTGRPDRNRREERDAARSGHDTYGNGDGVFIARNLNPCHNDMKPIHTRLARSVVKYGMVSASPDMTLNPMNPHPLREPFSVR